MKKLLVTGALGHIGSHLIRELPQQFPDLQIVLVDNLLTQRYASLFNLPSQASYRFIQADISTDDLAPLIREVDTVIHLAAITDAAGSFERASEVERNNFNSTKRIADACLYSNTKLITLSSTSVYGTQSLLVDEECLPSELKPQSPYASTKLKEEEYIQQLSTNQGLRSITCRFGTIFGPSPGMRFHTAVNKFCWQAVMGKPITVWETAYRQKRPYLDLNDASAAFIHILKHDLFDSRIYNVLTTNSTVEEVVASISAIIPDLKVEFVANKIMNQLSYEVANKRFESTGFQTKGSLNVGIRDTINLLRNSNNATH